MGPFEWKCDAALLDVLRSAEDGALISVNITPTPHRFPGLLAAIRSSRARGVEYNVIDLTVIVATLPKREMILLLARADVLSARLLDAESKLG